jgi:3-oxoacyl-[acyl-carrier protein] reductase
MGLEGQVAIVTGAAQGIGRAIAQALGQEGANIVLSDINLSKAEETGQEIATLGSKVLVVKADVARAEEAEQIVHRALEKWSRVDILVNNAGVTKDALVLRMRKEDWDYVLNINLTGTFNCTKATVKPMMKQHRGKIVNIASVVGVMGNAGQSNYAASKAGIIGLTKSLARELAPRRINVNAIAPGFIDTDMTKVLSKEIRDNMRSQIPLGRLGMSEDIAHCVKFLVSEEASYITGQVIHVNGGMYM